MTSSFGCKHPRGAQQDVSEKYRVSGDSEMTIGGRGELH